MSSFRPMNTAGLAGARRSGASKRWPRLSGSIGRDDDFAEDGTVGEGDLPLGGALEWQHAIDDGSDPPREGVGGQPQELRVRPPVRADDPMLAAEQVADIRGADRSRRGSGGDEPSALAERADRALPRARADGLDHDIGAALAGEAAHGDVPVGVRHVVDRLVGAERFEPGELLVARRERDDPSALEPRELHGAEPDTAGRRGDHDDVARGHPGVGDHHAPGGAPRYGQATGEIERVVWRNRDRLRRGGAHVLGEPARIQLAQHVAAQAAGGLAVQAVRAAAAAPVGIEEHALADERPVDAGSDLGDESRDFTATTISPGPATGRGHSRSSVSTSGPPWRWITTARMLFRSVIGWGSPG